MYHEFPTRPPGGPGHFNRSPRLVTVAASAIVLSVLGLGAAGAIVGGIALNSPGLASTDASGARAPEVPSSRTATTAPRATNPTPSVLPVPTVGPAPTVGPTPTASRSVPPTSPPTAPTPRPVPSVPATAPTASASPGPAPGGPRGVPAVPLHPVVGITDGDTITVRVGGRTERVRLIGLDAPELAGRECWAQEASSKLQSLVQSRSVQLVRDPSQADRDRYGRLLRHVSTADGQLVGQALLEGGFARELTHAGSYEHQAAFRAAERRAKAQRLGIWGRPCAGPLNGGLPLPLPSITGALPGSPLGGCVIKGNINREGEKIFHVPGGGSYDQTVVNVLTGERWFCTERQALDAGWRKARD